jgi:hypothetical protein
MHEWPCDGRQLQCWRPRKAFAFWFHTTTAYDIIRQCGVEIAKRDFMGTPA